MKKRIFALFHFAMVISVSYAQNVGIGVASPVHKLEVNGNVLANGGLFSSVGIGTTSPLYKLQIVDGSFAIFNSSDAKYWILNYNSTNNSFNIIEDGSYRMVIENGGNVGIGISNPAYKLDVTGAIRASGNIQTLSDLSVSGTATIEGGGGVAYNPANGNSMKVIPFTTANFHAVLGAHGSAETTIGLPSGFTSAPYVYVGNIKVTGGTAGELNRVILQLWGCTTTSCNAKIVNTDNASVDYNITWNVLAVGY